MGYSSGLRAALFLSFKLLPMTGFRTILAGPTPIVLKNLCIAGDTPVLLLIVNYQSLDKFPRISTTPMNAPDPIMVKAPVGFSEVAPVIKMMIPISNNTKPR
jgi:hypothetical protein